MAQFDVHRLAHRSELVIDCQSDLYDQFDTRFVVPLLPLDVAPPPAGRLNPKFAIKGGSYVMATQAATALRKAHLGPVVASLTSQRLAIVGALDVLITGV